MLNQISLLTVVCVNLVEPGGNDRSRIGNPDDLALQLLGRGVDVVIGSGLDGGMQTDSYAIESKAETVALETKWREGACEMELLKMRKAVCTRCISLPLK